MIIVCISNLFFTSHKSDNLDTPCGNITLHLGGILTSEMLTTVMLHQGHSSHVIAMNLTLGWRRQTYLFDC